MLARLRKATEDKDQGFTLIELLVVMIIIGILAAIAIPVFLNQRERAVDSSIKSDLKTIATEMETRFVDAGDYRERYRRLTGRSLDICPCCGGPMMSLGVLARPARPSPPLWPDTS